eukprot:2310966-Rhodomonas_salina.5
MGCEESRVPLCGTEKEKVRSRNVETGCSGWVGGDRDPLGEQRLRGEGEPQRLAVRRMMEAEQEYMPPSPRLTRRVRACRSQV